MTTQEMQTALETGFNRQGRRVSESMRCKYLTALSQIERPEMSREDYRGFEISGRSGKWFVAEFPVIYTSRASALAQVDRCLELRALMAEEQ